MACQLHAMQWKGRRGRSRYWWLSPLLVLFQSLLIWRAPIAAEGQQTCFYTDAKGVIRSSSTGFEGIPSEYQYSAQCHEKSRRSVVMPNDRGGATERNGDTAQINETTTGTLKELDPRVLESLLKHKKNSKGGKGADETGRSPDEVTLKGTTRDFDFTTSIGPVQLRWQTDVVQYFGKTPHEAVKIAWQAGVRTLARKSFPGFLRSSSYDWNIVFMDAEATKRTHPFGGEACHPAWIRPPAQVFVSAQLIGTACGSGKLSPDEAIAQLNRTLLHEFGHAIEYQLLGSAMSRSQRYHGEGFAEFFESIGVESLEGGYQQSVREEMRLRAKRVFDAGWTPASFAGSGEDYSRAYALIAVIAEKRGITTLAKVYEEMRDSTTMSFEEAVSAVTGWSQERWRKEAGHHLGVQ